MLETRQKDLIVEVVRSYIRAAEPIGSRHLEKKLGLSSATIRNEMAALEQEGFLHQPHTSAGRVPTDKAYQLYVDNFLKPHEPTPGEKKVLDKVKLASGKDDNILFKNLAKVMSDFSGQAVMVGFSSHDVYYTGLANLFAQPEFAAIQMVQHMSRIIDHLDEAMGGLYKSVGEEVNIHIGQKNPFGNECATVITGFSSDGQKSIIGFLGPWRMDYEGNVGRLNYVRKFIC
ncbi:TPA: hypothetical protein DIC39_00075 [Patescibacteria group bacterium]|nr:MAG: Transcriptional regulator of heat shock protein [Parcubacteria group bacterium GW2011_GWA2_46_39]HBV33635.1 hypothetical protein [Patescibacteria group bacterium]HCU47451.1 hypothetical protein [Patescibacteria group bacterium]